MQQEVQNMDLNTNDVMHGKYLVFKVGEGVYGIEIRYVMEIIGVQDITPIPHANDYVKGIINLRGTIVPVIDVGLRFGYEEREYTDRTCIIVLSMDNMNIGLIVDEVHEVLQINDEHIQKPPRASDDAIKDDFVKNIGIAGDSVKQLLDIYKIFEEEILPE